MSIKKTFTVKCPACGNEQEMTVWSSLNVQIDEKERELFLSEKINVFICNSCQTNARLEVPFMYHDMTRQFCVQYQPGDSISDDDIYEQYRAEENSSNVVFFLGPTDVPNQKDLGYLKRPHLVFSMEEAILYVRFMERLFEYRQNN